jgi:hypothetical protein
MKLNTANPSDHGMRFFTPELYLRFNSNDDAIADQADHDWEVATAAYQNQLKQIRSQLPGDVAKLAELCLHDAELLKYEHSPAINRWPETVILALQQGQTMTTATYLVTARPLEIPAPTNWPIGRTPVQWLYDEVAVSENVFEHRILFSDGHVLVIPFQSVILHTFAIHLPEPIYRQTA